jgi:hypothetical protein
MPSPAARRPPGRPFAWPVLATALALYVAAEYLFNLELVDTVAAADIDPARIDDLTVFGKLSGSFGLVLFAFRPMLARLWRRLGWGVAVLFVLAWVAGYSGLTAIYDTVLARIPLETQRDAYYLVAWRQAVFAGAVADPELRGADGRIDDANRLALVNIAKRLTDDGREADAMRALLAAQGRLSVDEGRLRDAVAAVFLPPMSMTLSLLAIVANLGALAAIGLSLTGRRRLRRIANILPIAAIALFLALADRPPFPESSRSYDLHAELGARLGPPGWLWGRAINGEAVLLGIPRLAAIPDV